MPWDWKFGKNVSVAKDATEDAWEGPQALYPEPSANESLFVASTSNADTGTFRLIRPQRQVGGKFVEQANADVTLTGQTPVAIPSTYNGTFRGRALAGNAGVVSVCSADNFSSGIPQNTAQVRISIPVGRGQTEMAIYRFPHTDAYGQSFTRWWVYATLAALMNEANLSNRGADFELVKKEPGDSAYSMANPIPLTLDGTGGMPFIPPLPLPHDRGWESGTWLKVQATARGGAVGAYAGFQYGTLQRL